MKRDSVFKRLFFIAVLIFSLVFSSALSFAQAKDLDGMASISRIDAVVTDIFPTEFGTDSKYISCELQIEDAHGIDEYSDIEVLIEDAGGTVMTQFEEVVSADSWDGELYVTAKLRLKSGKELIEGEEYLWVVKIDGKEMELSDAGNVIYIYEEPMINTWYWNYEDEKASYNVEGINLLGLTFTLEVQSGGEASTIRNVEAYWDEEFYKEVIDVDISGKVSASDKYTTVLYDEDGDVIDKAVWIDGEPLFEDDNSGDTGEEETDEEEEVNAVQFSDKDLENAVMASLGKAEGPVTEDDMLSLTELEPYDFTGKVDSLGGLEYAVNIESIDLSN